MNSLTDILYDSSLISSKNFKDAFSQNKILPPQNQFHHIPNSQMHTMDRQLPPINQSNVEMYNSPQQVCLTSNIDTGFEDGSNVSVFSDSFPEIVPSWLTHDFMKVSDNLTQPDILSNVSDVYATGNDTEHLEMLDLGFPTEFTSQDVASNLNDSQKLLIELPIQRFSNNNSLLMSSFNEMDVSHLNSVHYHKFKQNPHSMPSTNSDINTVLSCETDLHLPLSTNLAEQCLATSSPILPNTQSQLHPVDVCDKLPQINLNHLDSSLGSKTALSEIQLFRQDFANVPISNSSLNVCQTNLNGIGCESQMMLSSCTTLIQETQDAAVQVSENTVNGNLVNCASCTSVNLKSDIEIVQCFKCKFCDFVSLHKCAVNSHINVQHFESVSKVVNSNIYQNLQNSSFPLTNDKANDSHLLSNATSSFNTKSRNVRLSSDSSLVQNTQPMQCLICNKIYLDVTAYNMHLMSDHNISTDPVQMNFIQNTNFKCVQCSKLFSDTLSYKSHLARDHNVNLGHMQVSMNQNNLAYQVKPLDGFGNSSDNRVNLAPVHSNLVILQKNISKTSKTANIKAKPLKKADDSPKKVSKKQPSSKKASTASGEKAKSSHKKSWQKKLRRELGTYICESKRCNIRFRALDNLEYHRKCHKSEGSGFACPECGMTFENWGTMAGHLWRNHKNDMELHACDQCPFRTYSMSRLENTHKKIHLNELSFLCDTCGKKFKNGKQMRNHRATHNKKTKKEKTRVPDFKCKVCFSHFSSKVLLHHHQSTMHNIKQKSFMCNHCEFTTYNRSSLSMHQRQHTGEKPFQCDQCEYRTADHNSLRRHKMTHSGTKKYKCPFCPYSAIQASTFKSHMKKHPGHNGITFSCEICSFKTVNYASYLMHMKDHESINMIQNADSLEETHSSEDMYPLAEAMDISLSNGDNHLIPHLNKNKNMQSFFNSLGINLVSVGQESAT